MKLDLRRSIGLALAAALLAPRARRRPGAGDNQRHGQGRDGPRAARCHRGKRWTRREPAQVTFTDGTGQFTFSGLAPGSYELTFSLPGFNAPAQVVEVGPGATAMVDIAMENRTPGAGGRGREPRGATVGHGVGGAGRRDPGRGLHQPGRRRSHQPVADRGPVIQRQYPTDQRRGHHRAAGQPAQHGPGPYADPRQRQAPPPCGRYRVAGQRHRRRRAGARPVGHSLHRVAAGRGAARRRGSAVRLGTPSRA